MNKSGLADSPLFSTPNATQDLASPPPKKIKLKKGGKKKTKKVDTTMNPRSHDTTVSRNHETMVSRYHDTTIEAVRKTVKNFGKEAATYRFTVEEKKALQDMIYSYKGQGVKTSENEITRIAINFVFEDLNKYGKSSILDRVLKALNE